MSLTKTSLALFSAIVIMIAFSSFASAIGISPPPPPTELPEPGTLALFGFGLLGVVFASRHKQ